MSLLNSIWLKVCEMTDGALNPLGGFDVNVQDQTTPPIAFYFTKINDNQTTVAVETAVNDTTVQVASAADCTTGDYFGMFNSDDTSDNRAYFAEIRDVVSNTLTLDTPVDYAFQVGDTAACFERDMGTVSTATPANPSIFSIQVGPNATQSIDITRLLFSFECASAPNLAKFGDLPELTEGLVLRRKNGTYNNIWNVKSNREFGNLAYDIDIRLNTNPQQGENGVLVRYTFAGQDKHGVAVRLEPGDALELIIQEDISDLDKFSAIAEGHYVD